MAALLLGIELGEMREVAGVGWGYGSRNCGIIRFGGWRWDCWGVPTSRSASQTAGLECDDRGSSQSITAWGHDAQLMFNANSGGQEKRLSGEGVVKIDQRAGC